jgi:TRAP-type mannitol/chloroaromatic compound transport system permease small subunit
MGNHDPRRLPARWGAELNTRLLEHADRVTEATARSVAWLTALMVVLMVTVVVLRYAFDQGAIPIQEAIVYLHATVIMLGIPCALRDGVHVRVDILHSRLSERARGIIDVAGHLLFLVPTCLLILYFSIPYARNAWLVLEGSPEVGGIPAVFLLKTLIPVMAVALLLQGLAETVRRLPIILPSHFGSER